MNTPKLSIITATTPDRVQWATNCIETVSRQSGVWSGESGGRDLREAAGRQLLAPDSGLQTPDSEHLLICDGECSVLVGRAEDCGCRYVELFDGPHHDYGATAHQQGLDLAHGEFVCFWDDDNVYYPHALKTVLAATERDADVIVFQVRHYGEDQRYRVIPPGNWRPPVFEHACVDTMCLVLRREFALQASWIDDRLGERGSDFRWLSRLARFRPRVVFLPQVIGAHT